MSLFDRTLLAVAPGLAANRARARREYMQHQAATEVMRKYEAAKTGRRNEGWNRPATSANAEITSSASGLRNGARQLVRDNGHAANAKAVLTAYTVGTGIRPGFDTDNDALTRRLKELWEQHLESEKSGAGETGNFYDRQALGFNSIVESGSVIYRRRRRDSRSPLRLPYAIQVLEPDYLASIRDGVFGNNRIISGKEYDNRDELKAFHLYTQHPGDNFIGARGIGRTTRVLADHVSHAYRVERPGQVDGASWFAPVMTSLRDLADTRDAYQLRQKIAACYAVFIHESEPGAGTKHSGDPITDHIEPGRVESLPPGKDVTFATPPGVEGMADFDRAQLMTIAAGFGMPYEALTGDLRNVTFLSGRMGWLNFYRNIEQWRSRIVIPRICERELAWFLESAAVSIGINIPVRVTWTPPHRDLLDPQKEIEALQKEIRLGLLAPSDAVRMRGRDPNRVLNDWEKWAQEIDSKELVFDWDPRHFAPTGNVIEDEDNATNGGN